jgi:ABC-type multidrug transport system permease subunit
MFQKGIVENPRNFSDEKMRRIDSCSLFYKYNSVSVRNIDVNICDFSARCIIIVLFQLVFGTFVEFQESYVRIVVVVFFKLQKSFVCFRIYSIFSLVGSLVIVYYIYGYCSRVVNRCVDFQDMRSV